MDLFSNLIPFLTYKNNYVILNFAPIDLCKIGEKEGTKVPFNN
ncbi:hypothetical protein ASZ90_004370 [hydrocarbon metagenome]|uniref:Uncharacterized protein n=1 Tax=hydrocarbon metagenome TaxID=938273 RepID=A0A0W8FYF9_9ZZZZ